MCCDLCYAEAIFAAVQITEWARTKPYVIARKTVDKSICRRRSRITQSFAKSYPVTRSFAKSHQDRTERGTERCGEYGRDRTADRELGRDRTDGRHGTGRGTVAGQDRALTRDRTGDTDGTGQNTKTEEDRKHGRDQTEDRDATGDKVRMELVRGCFHPRMWPWFSRRRVARSGSRG